MDEINWAEEILKEQPDVVNNIPENGPVMKADESALGTNVQTDLNTDTKAGKIANMHPTIHEDNYIDNSGIALGSLPHNSFYSVKEYAKSKFPNMDINQAVGRFGQKDGRIYYLGTDEKLYYATPDFSAVKGNLGNVDEFVSRAVGPSMPIIAGTTGAILSGGNPFVAGASGVAGEGVRQSASKYFTGEELSFPERSVNLATAGAIELGGTVGGNILNGVIKKVLTKLPARIKNFDIGDKFAKYSTKISNSLSKASEKFGIKLTPAEISADGRLIKLQKLLANTKGSEEILETFYKIRNEDVKTAVYKAFVNIAEKEISPELAFKEAIKSANVVLKGEERILIDQASAYYKKAYEVNNVNIAPTLKMLNDAIKIAKGSTLSKLLYVKDMLVNKSNVAVQGPSRNGGPLLNKQIKTKETNLQSLDQVKREIDQIINSAGLTDNSIAKGNVVQFTKIKDNLLANMDEASPDYAKARAIYEVGKPTLDQVKRGFVNEIAKQNENMFYNAGKVLFTSQKSSVTDVKLAREMFFKHGQGDAWNQIVRGHLENVFESVLKEGNVGEIYNLAGHFYKKVFGTGKQRAIMLEALKNLRGTTQLPSGVQGPYQGFGVEFAELMTLLNRTTKAMKLNSHTAWMQEAQKDFTADAKPMLAKMVETIGIWNSPKRLSDWWTEIAKDKLAIKLAHILTSKNGQKEMAKLRELPSGGKAIIMAFTHLMAGGTLQDEEEGDIEMGQINKGSY
mgnify:CR=1 FL=1